jgi:hypothetical protein
LATFYKLAGRWLRAINFKIIVGRYDFLLTFSSGLRRIRFLEIEIHFQDDHSSPLFFGRRELDPSTLRGDFSSEQEMLQELQGKQSMQKVPSLSRLELFDELEANTTPKRRNGAMATGLSFFVRDAAAGIMPLDAGHSANPRSCLMGPSNEKGLGC